MKSLLFRIILTLGIGLALQVSADEIYKTVDEDGNVQYSDTAPSDEAELVDLPNINLQPGVTPRVRLSPEEDAGAAPIQVWIASPANQGTINPGALSFSVSGGTNRSLIESEYAQLLVNGSPYGDQSKVLSWSIGNLIRGEYQLEIQILSNGAVQSSSGTVTVFVQRSFAR